MAVFDPDADNGQALDYVIARAGFATMYWSSAVLTKAVTWLRSAGYHIVAVDAGLWGNAMGMHQALGSALDLTDYHGHLAELDDRMTDVRDPVHGLASNGAGLVLVMSRFDRFMAREPDTARALLEIVTGHAATGALIGIRMLCLVQSDDPDLDIPEIGAYRVPWNNADWFDRKRHPDTAGQRPAERT